MSPIIFPVVNAVLCGVLAWWAYGRGYRKGRWARTDEASHFEEGTTMTFHDGSYVVLRSVPAPGDPKEGT